MSHLDVYPVHQCQHTILLAIEDECNIELNTEQSFYLREKVSEAIRQCFTQCVSPAPFDVQGSSQ